MLKTKRGGLGRGFESLLGEAARDVIAQPEFEALKQIDAAKIRPGIYQPRKVFHDDTLQELAQSIAEHGILQPLVVRPVADSQYEIIAGERRFRAAGDLRRLVGDPDDRGDGHGLRRRVAGVLGGRPGRARRAHRRGRAVGARRARRQEGTDARRDEGRPAGNGNAAGPRPQRASLPPPRRVVLARGDPHGH